MGGVLGNADALTSHTQRRDRSLTWLANDGELNERKTMSISELIRRADNALRDLQRGFETLEETEATPADLEDALQMVHDAKNGLKDCTKSVREFHDKNTA